MSRISLSCTVLGLAAAEGPLLRLRNSAGSDNAGEALQESAAGSTTDSYTGTSSSSSSRDSGDVRGKRGGRRPPERTDNSEASESMPSELVSTSVSTMSLRQLQPEQYCTSTGETLSENEKVCLQTCHVIDGEIHPRFYQWEEYCKETSADAEWNDKCFDYYDCLLGCEVFQKITNMGTLDIPAKRDEVLKDMDPNAILDGDDKCNAEKCRSYCTRQTLGTCRELAFKAECEAMQRSQRLMRCSMDCNNATGLRLHLGVLLLIVTFLYSAIIG